VTTTPHEPQLPFQRLGDYEVLAPISEGGMATIWLGRSTRPPGKLAALKVIRPEHARNKEFVAMFLDEARIASRLSHPNVVALYGLGHDGKRHFLAMEVLRGRSLLALWEAARARHVRLAYEVIAWIGARIADALHHAHELCDESGTPQNVVHRDVNPANVFVTDEGVPKLIDFGLAKARDRFSSTAFGVVKGKIAYLSPEQTQGKAADRRADVFALSVTLWELSLDRRLFREDSDVGTIRRVREANVPDPRTLDDKYPPALAAAIVRGLARDPSERWQTAAELRDALDGFVHASGQRVDESSLRAVVAELSSGHGAASWEKLLDEARVGPERIRVWDDERQKMTWMAASIETAFPSDGSAPHDGEAPAVPEMAPETRRGRLERLLGERAAALAGAATAERDAIALARVELERALVDEWLGDGARAVSHAEASLAAAPTAAAHGVLRRLRHARGAAASLLPHLEAEIANVASDAARADLLAEKARLLQAAGQGIEAVRAAWERALAASPSHPAALRGLEGALMADGSAREALAEHRTRMAEAFAAEPRLAACLHVERARLLDRDLGRPDAAKAALERALAIDGGLGPVRAACVEHAIVHRDAPWLVALLEAEAALEPDPERAARLELDAASSARHRLGDAERSVALLEGAVARAPADPSVHRRALDELVELHEAAGRARESLRVRRIRAAHMEDARARAHEQRAMAALHESLGDAVAAVAALERALELSPADATLARELDRLLEGESLADRRIELWTRLAAATEDRDERGRCMARAAAIAEAVGDRARAVELLRAALVSCPADVDATDQLLRLLTDPASPQAVEEARARIAVHLLAAEHAADAARRVAHLEAAALLQEERLDDAPAAAATYEAILRAEPGRRGAVVGLARTAARSGDAAKLARARLDEASATADAATADALRVRAAEALAAGDADRALALAREVLARSPAHAGALGLVQRLHENAGRWAQVDATLAARIEHASEPRLRVDLWLARAELQRTRLRDVAGALASLRAALAIDASHPAARALVATLAASGDARALRDGLVELGSGEPTAEGRARLLARAAEIDELVRLDDDAAAALLERAAAEAPGDPWLLERTARVALRRSRTTSGAAFDADKDIEQARAAAEEALARDPAAPHAPHALRELERVARVTGSTPLLANALAQQADAFSAEGAVLGALWELAALVQWKLPDANDAATMDRILRLAPADRAALDATVRGGMRVARQGDPQARARLVAALRGRLAQASDDTERLWLHLTTALVLDREDIAHDDDTLAALASYREALRIDPRSVVAAEGAARLASALGDAEALVVASLAQADLTSEATRRAAHLVQAAGRLVSAQDPRLGGRPERLTRAAEALDAALDTDPESLSAVGLLVAVRSEQGMRDALLATLRRSFERARAPASVARLGAEVARVALLDPADRVVAAAALRRVLDVQPGDLGALRALADLHTAQGAWGDAVETLEAMASRARDPRHKLATLFELADAHAHLGRPADVERALTAALDVDPTSVAALRRLIAHRRASGATADVLAPLLARLADAETTPETRAAALSELADVHVAAGDDAAAERALVEATAQAATPERLARVLAVHAGSPADTTRLLGAVVARAQELERADAACLATLGRLEIETLGRWPDGVSHLRVALALAPGMHDARAALARGLLQMRAGTDALGLLEPMVVPDPSPLLALENPANALATFEGALSANGRQDEALVARELRALAGGLDDGAHVELRARRLVVDPAGPVPAALDAAALRTGVVPADAPSLWLDVAGALSGVETKLARADLEALGVSPRDRVTATAGGHPLLGLVHRLAAMFGLLLPETALSDAIAAPRVAIVDSPWLLVPRSMPSLPQPVQAAMLAGPLVRIALGLPWLDDLPGPYAHALLCGAARQAIPGFGRDLHDAGQESLVEEMARRVAKAIGRKQKKALSELAPALGATPSATLIDARAFERAVRRTELRAAFVATGDLLATIDAARAVDADLARATAGVGSAALAAVLTSPVAGDVARFALAPSTTALRWRAGTLWSGARGTAAR